MRVICKEGEITKLYSIKSNEVFIAVLINSWRSSIFRLIPPVNLNVLNVSLDTVNFGNNAWIEVKTSMSQSMLTLKAYSSLP